MTGNTVSAFNQKFIQRSSVMDSGFPRREGLRQPRSWGKNPIIWLDFCRKLHKLHESDWIWTGGFGAGRGESIRQCRDRLVLLSVVHSRTDSSWGAWGPYITQGMAFTLAWCVAMTLALTGLHTCQWAWGQRETPKQRFANFHVSPLKIALRYKVT